MVEIEGQPNHFPSFGILVILTVLLLIQVSLSYHLRRSDQSVWEELCR